MVAIIESTEEFVLQHDEKKTYIHQCQFSLSSVFRMLLQIYDDCELIDEDGFLLWIESREEEGKELSSNNEDDEEIDEIVKQRAVLFKDSAVQEFVAWVREEGESEEDDDEDDDDDDDD